MFRLALQEEARKKQELVKEAEEMSTKQVISSHKRVCVASLVILDKFLNPRDSSGFKSCWANPSSTQTSS